MDSKPNNEEDYPDEDTFWSETHVEKAIHDANELNRNPETLIFDRKAGIEDAPKPEFKTIYRKERERGIFRRFLNRFRSS